VHERRNAKRFTAPHIRSTIRGVIANRQKASVARELLDDLSKDVIRNDRNLQLWLANAAANNLRARSSRTRRRRRPSTRSHLRRRQPT
jgi:hypothetical protein